jgi:vacuolar-type H+-ATPase subunit F/Vma7
VIGDAAVVLGFALIGVEGCKPSEPETAARELGKALAPAPGEPQAAPRLVLITEEVAQWILPDIQRAVLAGALVQVIPGIAGPRTPRADEDRLLLAALGIKL